MPKNDIEKHVIQFGWPDNIQLPTLQEAEEAVQMIENMANELLGELDGRLEGMDSKALNTVITL